MAVVIIFLHDNSFHSHSKLLFKTVKLWLTNDQICFLYMEIYSSKLQGEKNIWTLSHVINMVIEGAEN